MKNGVAQRLCSPRQILLQAVLALVVALGCGSLHASGSGACDPVRLTFTDLSRGPADLPPSAGTEELLSLLPDAVRRLKDREVTLTGYLLPGTVENGRMRTLTMARAPGGCCQLHAQAMPVSERVEVYTVPAGIAVGRAVRVNVPVTLRGTLRLVPVRSAGVLTSYYLIENADVVSTEN